MDVERTLLWKAIQKGNLADVVAKGFKSEHFADPDVREVFDYGLDFMAEHGESPTTQIVKTEFPEFSAQVSKAPLTYLSKEFEKQVKERKAIELVRDYMDAIEDPDEIQNIEIRALDMARQLTEVVPSPRISRFSDKHRVDEYERKKKIGDIHGIYMGIPTLDEITMGIRPHELVTIAAYMGVGKSTLMQYIAYSAYLQGKKVLFVSLEMDADEIWNRIDVMASGVKYHSLAAYELSHGEKEAWKKVLDRAHENRHEQDIMIRDDIKNCTVDDVLAETMRHKPDLVIVDYLELMKTPRGVSSQHWEKVSFSGEGLKQNARVMKIPHLTAAQLTRDGGKGEVTLATVGYQSVGKHSDIVLGLSQDEEQEARQEMKVIGLKFRRGPKRTALMRWELERMDIGEKGVEERFPIRSDAQSMIGHKRKKARQLEVARTTGGKANPYAKKTKAKARRGEKKKVKIKRARR